MLTTRFTPASQSPSTAPTPPTFSDTPTDSATSATRQYTMANIPDEIEAIRAFFFYPTEEVRYSRAQFDQYWAFCSNQWVPSRLPYTAKRKDGKPGHVSRSFRCLLSPKKARAPATSDGSAARGTPRMKQSRVPIGCPATAKRVVFPDGTIAWGPARNPQPHNHPMEAIDATRKNLFLKGMARQEAAMGYAPSAIFDALTGQSGRREATEIAVRRVGGAWFTRQDVINAGAAFRKANPDARRVGRDFLPRIQMEQVVEFLGTKITEPGERWYCK